MKISDFLSSADVAIDGAFPDKQKLLSELSRKAGTKLDLPGERIFSELIKREDLGSTGVGGGVAIPHARLQQVAEPFGMFVRLKKPMEYDAIDGKPVDLVFLLLLPDSAGGEQPGALASAARKLRDQKVAAALRRARDSDELYRILTAD